MLRIPIVALLLLLISTNLAFAAERKKDPDLPTPDRPGTWHWMTQDPETTTSRCVGETKTPLCTIETFLACRIRADLELCRIAAVEDEYGNYSLHRDEYTRYRRVDAGRAKADNPKRHRWEAGDLWIAVLEWDCNPRSDMAQDQLHCRRFDRRQPPIAYVPQD
jgi:hypothetical protein